jgi:hypothetical protein
MTANTAFRRRLARVSLTGTAIEIPSYEFNIC